jgi:hypothetical protein
MLVMRRLLRWETRTYDLSRPAGIDRYFFY